MGIHASAMHNVVRENVASPQAIAAAELLDVDFLLPFCADTIPNFV